MEQDQLVGMDTWSPSRSAARLLIAPLVGVALTVVLYGTGVPELLDVNPMLSVGLRVGLLVGATMPMAYQDGLGRAFRIVMVVMMWVLALLLAVTVAAAEEFALYFSVSSTIHTASGIALGYFLGSKVVPVAADTVWFAGGGIAILESIARKKGRVIGLFLFARSGAGDFTGALERGTEMLQGVATLLPAEVGERWLRNSIDILGQCGDARQVNQAAAHFARAMLDNAIRLRLELPVSLEPILSKRRVVAGLGAALVVLGIAADVLHVVDAHLPVVALVMLGAVMLVVALIAYLCG